MKQGLGLWALTLTLMGFSAEAKLFSNSYVSFELPPNWDCTREGTEWVCVSSFAKNSKEAIIILTAKEAGPSDNLSAYMAHLKTPRQLPSKAGAVSPSKILSVTQRRINNHDWIDGLHLGSEVGTYYTRYLATTKESIAILVTFSAHKAHYTQYSNDFIRAIESLKVTASKDLLRNRPPSVAGGRGSESFGAPTPTGILGAEAPPPEDSTGRSGGLKQILGLALILTGIGLFLLLRKKSKKKKRSSK